MATESLELRGRRQQLLSTRLTQRIYDRTAPFYSLSPLLFHTRAHRLALQLAGPLEGRTVLEVSVGSGELFRELVNRNHTGMTVGVDLSPGMVSVVSKKLNGNGTHNGTHNGNGHAPGRFLLQAVDARQMPFPDGLFDSLFNCYLLELLPPGDIERAIGEFHRVMRPGGQLLLVNISDSSPAFNSLYSFLGYALPSFWGRQVAAQLPRLLEQGGFRIRHRAVVSQTFYPSLVTVAER